MGDHNCTDESPTANYYTIQSKKLLHYNDGQTDTESIFIVIQKLCFYQSKPERGKCCLLIS